MLQVDGLVTPGPTQLTVTEDTVAILVTVTETGRSLVPLTSTVVMVTGLHSPEPSIRHILLPSILSDFPIFEDF